jgi:hypothetical protein
MRFEQAIVGHTIKYFEKRFMDRWEFKEYTDPEKPVVFFGLVGLEDVYEKHKGYKVYLPSDEKEIELLKKLQDHRKTILIWSDANSHKNLNFFRCESEIVELKDYKLFVPNLMGDKIYYYSGFRNGWNVKRWNMDLIEEIQKKIEYEIITTQHKDISDYFDITTLKREYYDKTFLNLNLSGTHHMTTVIEMGLMGRKTITMNQNCPYKYSSIIKCKNVEEVVKKIYEEAEKINTVREKIDVHTLGDEWLNLEYWLKKE